MPVVAAKKIDCVGLFCPVPILRTRDALRQLAVGELLEMTADDPAAPADMRSFAARTGHALVEFETHGPVFRFVVRKTR
jgi:TusA-related sulfurtransferase